MRLLLFIMVALHSVCSSARGVYDADVLPADATPSKYLPLLAGRRVALVINQASGFNGKSLLDVLLDKHVNVVKIFVPEHGFRGRGDAGANVENSVDSATHLPIISLYGKHTKPTPEELVDVDVLVYDLQDVGVRFYTYISTLQYCMEACVQSRKQLVVLDRPDPNGFYVDGPVLRKENRSFVGLQPVPVVYGMTAGEYARMLVGEGWFDNASQLDMKVVPCTNYAHSKKYELKVPPSPNLRTMAAIYAYPSLCLFEGTLISVGRGTDLPFQRYGCPEFDSVAFKDFFVPQSGDGAKHPPYENRICHGELIGLGEESVLNTISRRFYINWLLRAYNAFPDKDKFFNSFFTKLGGPELEDAIKRGESPEAIRRSWQADLAEFKKVRKKYLLYEDFEH